MTITIDCSCGTSFEVELEPAAGPVSEPVGCPQCGTDAAAALNAALAAASADATEKPGTGPVTPALPTHCAQHPDQPVEMFCFVCKKPMCTTCMEKHGFVCSPYCRHKAHDQGLVIPTYEREQSAVRRRQRVRGQLVGFGITALVVLLIIAWVWWRQVGRKPRPVFTLELSGEGYGAQAQFLGPDQILYRTEGHLALYDARDGTKLWSTEAPQYHQARLLRVTDTDLWLSVDRSIVRLDRGTGEQAASWPLDRPALRYDVSDRGLLVVTAGTTNTQRQLTWLRLADGETSSQATTILVPPPAPPRRFEDVMAAADDQLPDLVAAHTVLLAAGPNVLQADIRLLATNIVTVQALKPRATRADGDMSVAQSMEIAEEVLNELQASKTGGIRREDQSRYRVALRRLFGEGAGEWVGEVTGPPAVFSLPSVDLLVAGTELRVFDRNNRLRWESKLAYPIAAGFDEPGLFPRDDGTPAPAVERDGILYFFDQGVLTAFGLDTGNVRWRLASVGISRLDFDEDGQLYVSTTSAGVESIRYSQQINLRDRTQPVILKLNPATGQVRWKAEDQGDRFLLSGRYLFFTRAQTSGLEMIAAVSKGQSAPVHFRLYRVDPDSGKILWEYYRQEEPADLAVHQNRILLVFPERLELLKFLSW